MAKILHSADLHLGIKLAGLGKSGDKVRAAIKDAFIRLIDICLESRVDALVIAGDLFDSNRVSKPLLDFVMREIARLGTIPAVVIPGTHDCLEENSIYATLDKSECPENLHLFNESGKTMISFPDKGLTFYAKPNESVRSNQNPLQGLKPDSSPGYHIAVAHGSVQIPGKSSADDWPISIDGLDSSGFNYVALGHWHSYYQALSRVPAVYCGSPEALSFKQKEPGWAVMVNLDEGRTEIEKLSTGHLDWKTIELPCTGFKYTLELEREISKHVGENRLLRVLLKGVFPSDGYIDLELLQENLADKFLHLEILNRSQSVPEDLVRLGLPETTIIGQYIRLLSQEISAERDSEKAQLLRESLKLGYALLSDKDAI